MAASTSAWHRRDHPAIQHPRRWRRVRRMVLTRDNYRCRRCGRAGALQCDHVKPIHHGGDHWNPDNLQSLCKHCHVLKTRSEIEKPDPARDRWRALVATPISE